MEPPLMTFFDENRSRRCGGNPVFDYVNVITKTTATTEQVHAGWVLPRMGRFRHRTDRHTRKRSCSGHSGAPSATDPLYARLGPPLPPADQHVHLDQLRRQLRDVTDLCSDLVAGAAIAMTRELQCPFDGGEDGPLAMRAASQPRALCPFEASQPPPLCVASCEDAALARTASKVSEEPARPAAAVG